LFYKIAWNGNKLKARHHNKGYKQWRLSAKNQSDMNKINIGTNIKVSDHKYATAHSQTVVGNFALS